MLLKKTIIIIATASATPTQPLFFSSSYCLNSVMLNREESSYTLLSVYKLNL